MTLASMRQEGPACGPWPACWSARCRPSAGSSGNTLGELPLRSYSLQVTAAGRRVAARPAAKLDLHSVGWSVVLTMLDWKWSPQQIAGTLKLVFADEPERCVSHETIYTAICAQPRGELRRQLIACLRHGRSTRMPRSRGDDRRGQIPEMISIHVRPPEIDDRVNREGDFTKGAGNKSSVGVLVERTSSRLVLLARRHLREHQRAAASVPSQGHRPERVQPGRARRHRRQLEQPTACYARIPLPSGGVRSNLDQFS